MIPDIQTGNYGIGAFFPLVVLDPTPRWRNQSPGTTPLRCTAETGQLLAVRWCAPDSLEAQAPIALAQAAALAPASDRLSIASDLAALRRALPQHTHLIALAPSIVIGPWSLRPGRRRATDRPRSVLTSTARLTPAA